MSSPTITRQLVDPASGEPFGEVADTTLAELDRVVTRSAAAQRSWATALPSQRSLVLNRLADLVEAEADTLSRLEVAETGKPWAVMRDGELPFAVDNLRFFAAAARSLDGSAAGVVSDGYTSMVLRRPVGVVAAITPWNFPLVMAVWKAGAALAAGCSVVLKPAPATPSTSTRLAELAREAGLPTDVFSVVTGDAEVGEALVTHDRTDMVTVTGSTATGRRVMAAAARRPTRVHLELGGKAPFVVFADADVPAVAAAAALASTYNSGQDCTAATRVYAEAAVRDELLDAIGAELDAIRLGGPDEGADIGPLISRAHRERVAGYVDRARAAGADVVRGGQAADRPGWFYEPTLVTAIRQDSELVQEEVFGPVLTVLPFESEDEAVALANDSAYGLASSVWTPRVDRAFRVAHRIEAGVTWINDHLPIASEMPHGGRRSSGFGKDMGHESVLEFTVGHHVMVKHAEPAPRSGFRPA